MLPSLASQNVDRIAAVGAYYIAASAFLLTILAAGVTIFGIYITFKHSSNLKKIEIDQNKFRNMFSLVRIVAGLDKDSLNGGSDFFMQLSAIKSLENFPEYLPVFHEMLQYYSTRTDWPEYTRVKLSEAAANLVEVSERKLGRKRLHS